MVSKDMLSKIPTEYKDLFVNTLNGLLQEERQVIYERSRKNVEALKADKHIGFNEWSTDNEELKKEISFINKLY
jgi:TRAP-type C4-dicarboxylate transport system substrate-binding protein